MFECWIETSNYVCNNEFSICSNFIDIKMIIEKTKYNYEFNTKNTLYLIISAENSWIYFDFFWYRLISKYNTFILSEKFVKGPPS